MSIQSQIRRTIHLIYYQLPVGKHTTGGCPECSQASRCNRECITCLQKQLTQLTSDHLAEEFIKAAKSARAAENALYQDLSVP